MRTSKEKQELLEQLKNHEINVVTPAAIILEYYDNNEQKRFWNSSTGKTSPVKEEVMEAGNKALEVSTNTGFLNDDVFQGVVIQYDKKLHMVCIITCITGPNIPVDKDSKDYPWQVLHRVYIDEDGDTYYINVSNKRNVQELLEFNERDLLINASKKGPVYIKDAFLRHIPAAMNPFRKLFGTIVPCFNHDKYYELSYLDTLYEVMLYVNNFDAMKTYTKMSVESMGSFYPNNPINARSFHTNKKDSYAELDKSDNGHILHFYYVKNHYGLEIARVYITDEKATHYMNILGKLYVSSPLKNWKHYCMSMEAISDDVEGVISHFYKEVNEQKYRAAALLAFLYCPVIEKLYKTEAKNMVKVLLNSLPNTYFQNVCCDIFGSYIISSLNVSSPSVFFKEAQDIDIYTAIGVTRHQFKKIMEIADSLYIYYPSNDESCSRFCERIENITIWTFRFLAWYRCVNEDKGVSDISTRETDWMIEMIKLFAKHADIFSGDDVLKDEKRKEIIEAYDEQQLTCFRYIKSTMEQICSMLRDLELAGTITTSQFMQITGNLLREGDKYQIQEYKDFLMMASFVNNSSVSNYEEIYTGEYTFHSVEDIHDMHELVLELHERQRFVNNIDKEVWEERRLIWQQLEYKDDTLCIITPNVPRELEIEGRELHHCVSSYITKVAAGDTNILFLRQVEDIEQPFYTIEVDTTNCIQQVHGKYNSKADDKIREFIVKWAKEKHLIVGDYDHVR